MPDFDKINVTKKVLGTVIGYGVSQIILGIVEAHTEDRDRLDQQVSIEVAKWGMTFAVKELVQDRVDQSVDNAYAKWLDFKQEVKDKIKEKDK